MAYGDEGDDGWCMTQDRSHGRFDGYEGARVDAIGSAGGVDTGCPVARRLDQRLSGPFGTTQVGW
jgi:hypothetical protein